MYPCINPVNPLNLNSLYPDGFSQTEMELSTIWPWLGKGLSFEDFQDGHHGYENRTTSVILI